MALRIIIVTFLMVVSPLLAYQVEFPDDTLRTSGVDTNKNVYVKNNTSVVKAMELYVTGREHDINGKETRPEIDDDNILVFPAQFLLYPGEERVVTLRWAGDRKLKHEQAYRLIIQEVSLKNKQENSEEVEAKVTLLLKFVRALYVRPKKAKPMFEIAGLKSLESNDKAGEKLEIVLHNAGTAHQIVRELELELSDASGAKKTILVNERDIPMSNLLVDEKRRIVIAKPKGLDGELKARIVKLK